MVKVFFSYSHRDETNRNELEKHLSVLKREGLIKTWYDRRILAGADLGNEIDQNLTESDLVLLLVSHEFLASAYCYGLEMKKALEMRERGAACVIPIILDHCDWRNTQLGNLMACPQDGRPISDYPNPNKGFNEITQEVRRVIREITSAETRTFKSEVRDARQVPGDEAKPTIVDRAVSGNLRIARQFSDYEKDTFTRNAFEYMARYFNNSLEELQKRNWDINFMFDRDANAFSVTIYRSGKEIAGCLVTNRAKGDSLRGIAYSHNKSESGVNALLSVEDDGYSLLLVPTFSMSGDKERLSEKGAAEFYWSMFVEQLQR